MPIQTTARRPLAALGAAAAALLLSLLALTACGSDDGAATAGEGGGSEGLDLVAYSAPESVYQDVLEPAFQKTGAGGGVDFSSSFGASGDQSRAVESGQPADVVHFAHGGDIDRLVESGDVAPDWDENRYRGFVQNSVVAIVTREGNPEGIRSFDDLVSKDISIVTPNPISSGGARWNIMAIYNNALAGGRSATQALEDVRTVLSKAEVQPGSASDALAAFSQGQGDVLISYENEAIRAEQEGEEIDYVVPDNTILIQTPIAVTKEAPPSAQAFIDFLRSDEGQRLWAEHGYRPVNEDLVDPERFPAPEGLVTIEKFGGWSKVNEEFFDAQSGSVAEIEQDLGVSAAG